MIRPIICLVCDKDLGTMGHEISGTVQMGQGKGQELLSFCGHKHKEEFMKAHPNIFEELKVYNKNYERKTQEALNKIFLNKEESLRLRKQNLQEMERELKDTKIICKQLKEVTGKADEIIGSMIREFERKNPPTEQVSEYFALFWDYVSKEATKRFQSSHLEGVKKDKARVNKIRSYERKLKNLKSTKIAVLTEGDSK